MGREDTVSSTSTFSTTSTSSTTTTFFSSFTFSVSLGAGDAAGLAGFYPTEGADIFGFWGLARRVPTLAPTLVGGVPGRVRLA